MTLVEEAQGAFGPIRVIERNGCRALTINGQTQGASFIDKKTKEPGAIAESAYQAGWLLAGSQNPKGSGFMVGLGAGTGVCSLLASFPDFDLTVVEIDPVIVRLACKHFPLLSQYQDEGRLHIRTGDAVEVLADAVDGDTRWDVGFLDAYTGKNDLVAPPELVGLLVDCCEHLYVNCIDKEDGTHVRDLRDMLAANGRPVQWLFNCLGDHTSRANLILTTQELVLRDADEFSPFEDDDTDPAEAAREDYARMLGHGSRLNDHLD